MLVGIPLGAAEGVEVGPTLGPGVGATVTYIERLQFDFLRGPRICATIVIYLPLGNGEGLVVGLLVGGGVGLGVGHCTK
jgi:hypothetical protein